MKAMRRALANGLLRGGVALSLAYLLVLQSLIAGMAQGAMAGAGAGPLAVICTPRGLVAVDPAADPDLPGKTLLHWHCAAHCQLASAATPVAAGARAGAISAPRQQVIAIAFTPADIAPSACEQRVAEARAPPFSL